MFLLGRLRLLHLIAQGCPMHPHALGVAVFNDPHPYFKRTLRRLKLRAQRCRKPALALEQGGVAEHHMGISGKSVVHLIAKFNRDRAESQPMHDFIGI